MKHLPPNISPQFTAKLIASRDSHFQKFTDKVSQERELVSNLLLAAGFDGTKATLSDSTWFNPTLNTMHYECIPCFLEEDGSYEHSNSLRIVFKFPKGITPVPSEGYKNLLARLIDQLASTNNRRLHDSATETFTKALSSLSTDDVLLYSVGFHKFLSECLIRRSHMMQDIYNTNATYIFIRESLVLANGQFTYMLTPVDTNSYN
jgi:hypothetical protein